LDVRVCGNKKSSKSDRKGGGGTIKKVRMGRVVKDMERDGEYRCGENNESVRYVRREEIWVKRFNTHEVTVRSAV
jgi:hypothetical protein